MTNVLEGAEPFSAAGGPVGVLVVHGFTGSPGSMRALAEGVAAAGHTVELPLLPGHGTTVDDMLQTSWADSALGIRIPASPGTRIAAISFFQWGVETWLILT